MEQAKVGYEAYEDKRTFEKSKDYLDGISYPCMIVDLSSGINIPKSRMLTLKGMMDSANVSVGKVADPVNLYFRTDKLMLVGKLQARQIKSFLKLFDEVSIKGFLDADTELQGDKLYVLSDLWRFIWSRKLR